MFAVQCVMYCIMNKLNFFSKAMKFYDPKTNCLHCLVCLWRQIPTGKLQVVLKFGKYLSFSLTGGKIENSHIIVLCNVSSIKILSLIVYTSSTVVTSTLQNNAPAHRPQLVCNYTWTSRLRPATFFINLKFKNMYSNKVKFQSYFIKTEQ